MATTFRAKQVSTNKWLQIVHCSDPPGTEAAFKMRCASAFSIAETDLTVVASDWTSAQRETAAQEMGAGTHEGLAVVAAAVPPVPPAGRDFLKGGLLPNIDGATTAAKRTRLATLLATDQGLANFFALCNTYATLTNADHVFARNLWATTLAVGGLTAGEVRAIEAAAPAYGLTLP